MDHQIPPFIAATNTPQSSKDGDDAELRTLLRFMTIFHPKLQQLLQIISSSSSETDGNANLVRQIELFENYRQLLQSQFECLESVCQLPLQEKVSELMQYSLLPVVLCFEKYSKVVQPSACSKITSTSNSARALRSKENQCINIALQCLEAVLEIDDGIPDNLLLQCMSHCLHTLPDPDNFLNVKMDDSTTTQLDEKVPYATLVFQVIAKIAMRLPLLDSNVHGVDMMAQIIHVALAYDHTFILKDLLECSTDTAGGGDGNDVWIKFFPGCFVGLYKSVRKALPAFSSKRAISGIESLALLIERVLPASTRVEIQPSTSNIDIDSTASVIYFCKNSPDNSKTKATREEGCKVEYSRLTLPLKLLFSNIQHSSNCKIRRAGRKLCNSILVVDVDEELFESSIECLICISDTDGEALPHLPAHVEPFSKIIANVEKIPSLAYSQQSQSLEILLKIINFYCTHIPTSKIKSNPHNEDPSGISLASESVARSLLSSFAVLFSIEQDPCYVLSKCNIFSRENTSAKYKFLQPSGLQNIAFGVLSSMTRSMGSYVNDFVEQCADIVFSENENENEMDDYGLESDLQTLSFADVEQINGTMNGISGAKKESSLHVDSSKAGEQTAILIVLRAVILADRDQKRLRMTTLNSILQMIFESPFLYTNPAKIQRNLFLSSMLQLLAAVAIWIGDVAYHQVIFPLIRSMSSTNDMYVQNAAKSSLCALIDEKMVVDHTAVFWHLSQVDVDERMLSSFLFGYREAIVDGITRVIKYETSVECLSAITFVLGFWAAEIETNCNIQNEIYLLVELIETLLASYDRDQNQCADLILSLLNVFSATFDILLVLITKINLPLGKEEFVDDLSSTVKPWMKDLLSKFGRHNKTACGSCVDAYMENTPQDWFEQYHVTAKEKVDAEENDRSLDKVNDARYASEINQAVRLCNNLLRRASFFLSSTNVKIHHTSCRSLRKGFEVLNLSKMENNSSTHLLPSIHEHWPSIRTRMKDCASKLSSAYSLKFNFSKNIMITSSPNSDSDKLGAVTTHFINLLYLVSALCKEGVDFMGSRFKDDVWPILAMTLRNQLKWLSLQQKDNRTINRHILPSVADKTRNKSTEAVLKCLSQSISVSEFGVCIADLFVAIGTAALPFFSDDGEVGDAAVLLVKSILRIDCDCLWGKLCTLAGRPLSPLSIHIPNAVPAQSDYSMNIKNSNLVSRRANEMVLFIEELDEQILR